MWQGSVILSMVLSLTWWFCLRQLHIQSHSITFEAWWLKFWVSSLSFCAVSLCLLSWKVLQSHYQWKFQQLGHYSVPGSWVRDATWNVDLIANQMVSHPSPKFHLTHCVSGSLPVTLYQLSSLGSGSWNRAKSAKGLLASNSCERKNNKSKKSQICEEDLQRLYKPREL
jgi:hypothetical protein